MAISDHIIEYVLRRPRLSVCSLLFLICSLGLGACFLTLSSDARVFFPQTSVHYKTLTNFEEKYGAEPQLLISFHAKEADVFSERRLGVLHGIALRCWQLPYAVDVKSIFNSVRIRSVDDELHIGEMVDRLDLTNPAPARARVLEDNLLTGKLVSRDGQTTGIVVSFRYSKDDKSAPAEILSAVRSMLSEFPLSSVGLEVWLTGRVAISSAFSSAARGDLLLLIPLSCGVTLVLLIVLLRSPRIACGLVTAGLLAAVGSFGAAGWLGFEINSATGSAVSIVFALFIASQMHFAIGTVRVFAIPGCSLAHALRAAFKSNFVPTAITLLTTSVGFLLLNSADSPPFRDFGNIVAVGALLCLVLGAFFLPGLFFLIGSDKKRELKCLNASLSRAAEFEKRNGLLLIGVVIILVGLTAVGLGHLRVDDNFHEYLDGRFDYRKYNDLTNKYLTGSDLIELDLDTGATDGALRIQYMEGLIDFTKWAETQPNVRHVSTIAEIFLRLNQHIKGGLSADYSLPKEPNALSQYLLIYESSSGTQHALGQRISLDRSSSRVTVTLSSSKSSEIKAFIKNARFWLSQNVPDVKTVNGTGLSAMYAELTETNVRSMVYGGLASLVVISGILVFVFRSFALGIFSLIPNLLPVVICLGAWGLLVGDMGIAVAVVGVVTLGIIVDDTVHILWNYKMLRDSGLPNNEAIDGTLRITGAPIFLSTVTLGAGFLVIACSGFFINSVIGLMGASTILIAIIVDFYLLIPVLRRMHIK